MNTDEQNNKNIETIYNLLDEKEMHEEIETLDTVIAGYNSSIDETVGLLTQMVEKTENLHLEYTDFLYLMITIYSIYSSIAYKDIFGLIFVFSCLLLWTWRDTIITKVFNVWRK